MTAWLALAVALAIPVVRCQAMLRQNLHGKWDATVTADADGKSHADLLTFTNGDQFGSDEMDKGGFKAATYTGNGSPIGAAEQFDVTLTNKAGDTARWQGENLGGQMTGTLTLTRKGGDTVTYQFKATRK